MLRSLHSITMATALTFVAGLAQAQPVVRAHYFTFDVASDEVLAPGDAYLAASPERFWSVTQILAFEGGVGGDGPAVLAAASLPGALQGGGVLACDGNPPGQDEGLWVVMSEGFPIGDVTVEAMFYMSELTPSRPFTNLGLQYVVSTEIPGGGAQYPQGQIRLVNGLLQWNAGEPPAGGPERRVETPAVLSANTWYHAVGVIDYNDGNPAASELRLYLRANGVAGLADLVGTAAIDLDDPAVTVGWAPPATAAQGPILTAVNRYCIGCSPSNSINGSDLRGLQGEIDAVAVTDQAGAIYLPDQPPFPPVTGADSWSIYR